MTHTFSGGPQRTGVRSSPSIGTLLCPVKGRERLQVSEELAGDVALQASFDLADALALGDAPLDVRLGLGSWRMRTITMVCRARLS
jgi:hypothetical protein